MSHSNKTQVYLENRLLLEKLKMRCSDYKHFHLALPQTQQIFAWTSAVSSAEGDIPSGIPLSSMLLQAP